jgi:hypothetical protein
MDESSVSMRDSALTDRDPMALWEQGVASSNLAVPIGFMNREYPRTLARRLGRDDLRISVYILVL